MADNQPFFPGFEGDDDPPKTEAKPAPPAAPAAPAPAKKPAFDPFAKAPDGSPPAPAKAPAPAAKPAAAAAPAAAPAPAAADGEEDVKPGSRKDLWKCPHCGAGNKPDRDTCRVCAKTPYEPVVVPWFKRPLVRAGIVAAIGLVIILVVWLTRVDTGLHEADLASVDQRPRISGTATGSIELGGGLRFEAEKLFAVCGRVAAVGNGPGGTQLVVLALGRNAADEKPAFDKIGNGFAISGGVVLACSGDGLPPVKPGQILSIAGATGRLMKEGQFAKEGEGLTAVHVDTAKVGK